MFHVNYTAACFIIFISGVTSSNVSQVSKALTASTESSPAERLKIRNESLFLQGNHSYAWPSCVPPRPDLNETLEMTPDAFVTDDPTTQAKLYLRNDLFSDENGEILYYALLIARVPLEDAPTSGSWDGKSWPSIPDWTSASNGSTTYQATPAFWNPFPKVEAKYSEPIFQPYVLGTGECDSYGSCNYCNAALQPDQQYALKIRAFTSRGYQDTYVLYFKTLKHLPLSVIIIVFGWVFVISLAVILIISFNVDLFRLFKVGDERKRLSVIPTDRSPKKFLEYSDRLLNTEGRLRTEFQLLGTLSVDVSTPCIYGKRIENKQKNRYMNILPFDVSRVKLSIVDDDPASDYINANFIRGYSNEIEYIASQGPKEETCHDFWRMVLEQNIEIIVMLTELMEYGVERCFKYYPDEGEEFVFQNINVTCTYTDGNSTPVKRTIQVKQGSKEATVSHFHFKSWNDFQCPGNPETVLELCYMLREFSRTGYILIHCSAGVGRTGTLIALDILLQRLKDNHKLNVFNTVLELRRQRINMVQTETQYGYIYKFICNVISRSMDKAGDK